MNFKKIYEMQVKLDKSIEKKSNIRPEDVIDKKILALVVEVGEFANEYAAFKYWKLNKIINQEKLIEEFIDGIHFLVSMGIYLEANQNVIPKIISQDKSIQLLSTISEILKLRNSFNKKTLENAFSVYMGNAKLLHITDQEIEISYAKKNKINFERIKNKY